MLIVQLNAAKLVAMEGNCDPNYKDTSLFRELFPKEGLVKLPPCTEAQLKGLRFKPLDGEFFSKRLSDSNFRTLLVEKTTSNSDDQSSSQYDTDILEKKTADGSLRGQQGKPPISSAPGYTTIGH